MPESGVNSKNLSMKKYFIIVCFTILSVFSAVSKPALKAFLTYATFNNPSKGTYIETYISIIGRTVNFVKNTKGNYQGEVNIAINFSINNEIKSAKKYTLTSPEIKDTLTEFPNFIDQQRFSLPNGKYSMEISISDKNNSSVAPFVNSVPVEINLSSENISISDVQFLESYSKSSTSSMITKSGFDLVPYVSTFFPENIKQIKFYTEIYNTKKVLGEDQKLLVTYSIESYQSNVRLNNFSAFSKQKSSEVNILLSELNIESLPSGNYNLVVEISDKDNNVKATRTCFFQRKNKPTTLALDDLKSIDVSSTFVKYYKSIDTLYNYIRCLRPISSSTEIQFAENQLKARDLILMQQFFYNFWKSRNEIQPETAWREYYDEVKKVNKEFGSINIKGYNTDRGRVYLQYGPPSVRGQYEHEPNAYPFEVWQYDVLVDNSLLLTNPNNRQSNKKFVFVDNDLSSNKYNLIQSTAKGELTNSQWKTSLYNSVSDANNPTPDKVPYDFESLITEIYNNPR